MQRRSQREFPPSPLSDPMVASDVRRVIGDQGLVDEAALDLIDVVDQSSR